MKKPSHADATEIFQKLSGELNLAIGFNGRFETLYAASENTYGTAVEEWKSKPFIEFLHPEEREQASAALQKLMRRSGRDSFEARLLCKDGSFRWMQWTLMSRKSEKVIYAHARDITARKETERSLPEQNEEWSEFVENVPIALHWVGPDGKILWANRTELEMLGYQPEEYIGRHISEFHVDSEVIADLLQRLSRLESVRDYEARMRCKDGSIKLVLISSNVKTRNGKFLHTRCFTFDITERRLAEERFRLAVQSAPSGIVMTDAKGRILLVNKQIEKYFGYSQEELIGRLIEILVPQRFRGKHPTFRKDFGKNPEARPMGAGRDLFGLRKDGSEFPIEIGLSPTHTGSGMLVLSTVVDISERKRMEMELRESEERFRLMADSAPVMIWISDTSTLCTFFNKPWLEFTGRTMKEEIGNGWAKGVHPEDFQSCLNTYLSSFYNHEPFQMEYRLRRHDGEYRWVLNIGVPHFGPNQSFMGYIGSCIDITERKAAEEQIRQFNLELEQRVADATAELEATNEDLEDEVEQHRTTSEGLRLHSAIVSNMSEGVCLVRALNGEIVYTNDKFEQMFGYESGELFGRHISVVYYAIPGRSAQEVAVDIMSEVRQRGDVVIETHNVKKGGTPFWSRAHISTFDHPEFGTVWLAIHEDITERRQAEQEIQKLNTELEERVQRRTAELETSNRELESFSYSVSHDLSAPLRTIDGFSHFLLEEYGNQLDRQAQDYLQRMRAASQNMAHLIDALLNLARMTRREMQREVVNLSGLAVGISLDLQRAEPDRKVEFTMAEGIMATGDPHLLRVVLENLLGNAWKFTSKHQQAHVEFGVKDEEGKRVYFVRDDGAGFEMKYVNKLFGAFQRLHLKTDYPGTGIGLATVQRISHRHGGKAWAQGEVENGATFFFTLG